MITPYIIFRQTYNITLINIFANKSLIIAIVKLCADVEPQFTGKTVCN